ncbi:alpha-aminoadipic semialdehyde synthase isoform X1 [Amborella trichopoda]|uniref:alpha-aminoadipic semialdehyde synthase isoform X1 n=1 Tax=Amborella trichopoda TaxID=13333 RepID=UPI0009C14D33|nr:alpha-aminoadipic semialdehyde synthase isoform X1 [Amborella trichopoda]XP_020531944.1 alpha-aminoadipic semialdehyde synthase isoform X1 [Amborella trichopoda]|eukprot:XP_020531935.1 alpha-aminoadipic semialdehyde synthase isoform X1 [Amborella trichopoda]
MPSLLLCTMYGNGVVGILSESCNLWERRAPLNPSHCARLLHSGSNKSGIDRIIVQPCTKRIHHDSEYEDVGCEISDDLSDCGLILGVKQPKMEMIKPDRAYAFFSHTHKAQRENMPLLDKILKERGSLYDYERMVGENGKRLLAFGKFAGRAGIIDLLSSLGKRYLNMGYSTPFLSLGASYMYSSLSAAKSAVIAVGEEIATLGLPSGISPVVFVFTGSGNVSQGAQEIFKLLPHAFVDPSILPELVGTDGDLVQSRASRRNFQVYGCVVTCEDMVTPLDPAKTFDKADYYAHPEHYIPIFHERIAPYASVMVNCMYWERRFPRLLSTKQLQDIMRKGCPLVGISDITCDVAGSIEFVNQITSIENPFFRYNPFTTSYHEDMRGEGIICLAVDILPTEFPREATQYFGDVLSNFIGVLASTINISDLPPHLRRACISHKGVLTPLYEYIPRMRNSDSVDSPLNPCNSLPKKYTILVSLSGHLFDQFFINEALDIIEAAGGSFHLVRCEVGQSADALSFSELEVGADDQSILEQIIDSLSSIAKPSDDSEARVSRRGTYGFSLKVGKVGETMVQTRDHMEERPAVLILGAGRVCEPAVELLASSGSGSHSWFKNHFGSDTNGPKDVQVIVASLYLKDAEKIIEDFPNAIAIELDAMDHSSLCKYVSQVEVVISLLPPSFHSIVAKACIELKKHLVTASYVNDSMSKLDEMAKGAGIAILCEMGLDPGIDHMMAMKMIHEAHGRGGIINSFVSYCGGLPSPAAANNPLAYKFSWNPAGAIKAGRNPAKYKYQGEIIHVDGNALYDSATRFQIPDLPAFALEHLPNRDSVVYGDLYGIGHEASTVFRATLRYEGYSEIMSCLAKLGYFDSDIHPLLKEGKRPTFGTFLEGLLKIKESNDLEMFGKFGEEKLGEEKQMVLMLIKSGYCKELSSAEKTVKTIRFLGLDGHDEIPEACQSAFDVICLRMEERLSYSDDEKDMVLLQHEVEVGFEDGRPSESHRATLLEFGKIQNGKNTTAMARTVGIPAAIGALLLVENKITSRGIIRPLEPEVYEPALNILETMGFGIFEKKECA